MNKLYLLFVIPVLVGGCLDFGDDEVTTSPTKAQVDRCRSAMYLKSSADIDPLGYMLFDSGIDGSIWFKFKSKSSDLTEIFDTKVVDVSKFQDGFTHYEKKELKWWDVKGKKFYGGQVSLPNVRYMNVGVEKTDQGYLVYIYWYEM
ncbi:MAG: hypothetical protein FVQ82_12220 [Planctomycetes bacterium]|nr:hypothetical protein [Planctomycetota bacterium]